ncbi:predicted protein [Botrytis cinerea T4]|uniref:Uncharacterized protein n=1 Tax=Botryotinia fuckeliana (strain T4) TaxID=999810 RepID=G2YFL3_BOTF4|nr:predicted protein [Botrytis cinerea T4]
MFKDGAECTITCTFISYSSASSYQIQYVSSDECWKVIGIIHK